ncbi:hypothetical protein B0J13DRAFT_646117 [Dactylonectria estremocensis]|uniref:Rhodopsin domain-containing protein n=1 Tax=Dactylonectria estremocensis TaxID=1079267 RepID=A0A9P9IMJ0_9HYPO|nr:hypothetical protein B0J13DRAFT_646117 [Dactylonectria estremocensis]
MVISHLLRDAKLCEREAFFTRSLAPSRFNRYRPEVAAIGPDDPVTSPTPGGGAETKGYLDLSRNAASSWQFARANGGEDGDVMFPSPGPLAVMVAIWLLTGIATVVIVARLYLRLVIQKRRIWASDIFMCGAWASAVATAAMYHLLVRQGVLDKSVTTDMQGYKGDIEDIPRIFELFWIANFPFILTFYLCKAALLATFFKLFPEFMRWQRILLWATSIFIGAAYLTSLILQLTQCQPLSSLWDFDELTSCSVEKEFVLLFRVDWALHFSSDVFVFILPWLVIPQLVMRKRLKIGIYFTFALGIVSITFCVIRCIVFEKTAARIRIPVSYTILWCSLEIGVTLIIACLPSLGPYFNMRRSRSSDYIDTEATEMQISTTQDVSTKTSWDPIARAREATVSRSRTTSWYRTSQTETLTDQCERAQRGNGDGSQMEFSRASERNPV